MRPVQIGERLVGQEQPTFIVAELSANHNKSLSLARETVIAAADAGADAVKLQTYTPETITMQSSADIFKVRGGTPWDGRTLYSIYEEGYLPWEWHEELFELARRLGIEAFSSPFDPSAADFLDALGVPAFKIASLEIVDLPLVRYVAEKGKPVILSTGIATEYEIQAAVNACRQVGNDDVIVLKCTSAYPAVEGELNLRAIGSIPDRFSCLAGFSDHTMGFVAPVVAVALGACVIERHIMIDKVQPGLDSTFSTDAASFRELVLRIREAEAATGEDSFRLSDRARESRALARSLFVVQDVNEGDVVTNQNVRSIRPGNGMDPESLQNVLGRSFSRGVLAGTPLGWEHLHELS